MPSSHYDTNRLRQTNYEAFQDREETIRELMAENSAGRATTFELNFLNHLLTYPELSLADAWDDVEAHFAKQAGVRPRQNPYR